MCDAYVLTLPEKQGKGNLLDCPLPYENTTV